jgi:hypothetical protein
MANTSLTDNRAINLDTFTSAISMTKIKVHSIEWVSPDTFGDTCTITLGSSGPSVVEWNCHDVNYSYIKYFPPLMYEELYIAASGVDSGKLIIIVR